MPDPNTELAAAGAATYQRKVSASAAVSRAASAAGREIPPIDLRAIDWKRRLACERDLMRFGMTYLPKIFKLPPGRDHERCVAKMERVKLEGGLFALAMARGGGKTAWCRANMLWGVGYGHRRYSTLLGANEKLARKTLKALRIISLRNEALLQDFPELFAPIRALGQDSAHKARGQLYRGQPTFLEWGPATIKFPCLVLSREEAKPYFDHAPDLLVEIEGGYAPRTCGAFLETAGITAGIRGGNEMHPLFGDLMRPDDVLLDDVQNDEGALSGPTCAKLITIIDGTVEGLAGPGELPSMFMPCTVIMEGDVSDTYLDQTKKPEWQGERCPMVAAWPKGIDDYEIDEKSVAGRHWLEYDGLRIQSFRQHGDLRLATAYYAAHRKPMDAGFDVSWEARFNNQERHAQNRELSAQQHAMNKRFKSPSTFAAEYQQRPKKLVATATVKAPDLAERTSSVVRGECPPNTHAVNTFVDVQDEILFYVTLATDRDYTGVVIDYGTWPEVPAPYFTKAQTEGWLLLSKALFDAYPQAQAQAQQNARGRISAPLEAKIYHAIKRCAEWLLAKEYPRAGGGLLRNQKIGIDIRWGKASNAMKRAIFDLKRNELVPTMGQFVSPYNRQFEEYTRTPGWMFEDQVHPGLQEVKWVWRPGPDGRYYLAIDTNRVKSFLMERLSCPPGAPGAIQFFRAPAERHKLISEHLADSEYPEPVEARGRKKDIWQSRDGRPDNDFFDCLAALMALASMTGARLQENLDAKTAGQPRRPSLKDRWRAKHGG